jgi:DNA-binding NarL/FixJ family response regulator
VALDVVVGEDSLLVREGLASLLDADPAVGRVRLCDDFESLLDLVGAEPPDVVVTDIRMPPDHRDEGIRVAVRLRTTHPDVGVVVLSAHAEPAYAVELFAAGSERRAYLLKDRLTEPGQLMAAITAVAVGGSVVDPKVVEMLIAARTDTGPSPVRRLSPREREVLAGMAQGKNNAAIAESLVLSIRAVEKHINSVFSKLGLHDETDAHHRVRAVLLYLADAGPGASSAPGE